MKRMNLNSVTGPALARAAVYAVSLVLSLLVVLGVIQQDQADAAMDSVPKIVAAIVSVVAPGLALLNIHRGSDSRVTEDDLRQAVAGVQADAESVAEIVVERLSGVWDTSGTHSAVSAPAEPVVSPVVEDAYPGGGGQAGEYPGGA